MADELTPEELDKLAAQQGEVSPEQLDAMQKQMPPVPTTAQAFGRGAVKGATLGLSTPAAGAGAAAADWATIHVPSVMKMLGYETGYPKELPSPGEAFQEAAGHRAAGDEEASQAHGGAFLGGQLVGGIAPSLVGAGAGGLARNVTQAAAMGGISGAAEASPSGDIGEIAKGAGVGMATGAVSGTLPSAIGAIGRNMTKVGQRAGVRALGLTLADVKAFAKQGGSKLENILGVLGEEPGSVGIRALGNPASNVERLGEVVGQTGKDVGSAVSKVQSEGAPVSRGLIGDLLSKQIKDAEGRSGVSESYISALKQEAKNVMRGGGEDETAMLRQKLSGEYPPEVVEKLIAQNTKSSTAATDMGPEAIHQAMMEISPRAQGIYSNVLGPAEKSSAAAAADTRRVLAEVLHKQAMAAGVGGELEKANAIHGVLRSLYDRARPRAPGEEFGNRTLGYTGSHLAGPVFGAAIGGGASSGDPSDRAMHALEGAALGLGARRGMQVSANMTSLAAPVLSRALRAISQAPIAKAAINSATRPIGNALAESKRKEKLAHMVSNPEDTFGGQ